MKNTNPKKDNAVSGCGASQTAHENAQQTNHSGNEASAQRNRLIEHLRREFTVTTLEARRKLDVLHPAARVMELRRQGYNIVTIWTHDQTSEGKVHRVAKYMLTSGGAA